MEQGQVKMNTTQVTRFVLFIFHENLEENQEKSGNIEKILGNIHKIKGNLEKTQKI
jgi:hypothetical protein